MLQDPATRCDLDEVLSLYDLGPKTPDEHEKLLFEISDAFSRVGRRRRQEDGDDSEDSSS